MFGGKIIVAKEGNGFESSVSVRKRFVFCFKQLGKITHLKIKNNVDLKKTNKIIKQTKNKCLTLVI